MRVKRVLVLIVVIIPITTIALGVYLRDHKVAPPALIAAARHGIRAVVSTNGIVEPVNRLDVVAPFDGFVASVDTLEGATVEKGQLICRVGSDTTLSALAEARASLLRAKSEARPVLTGPQPDEVAALDASIAESQLRLSQAQSSLREEEALLTKQATTRYEVEKLRRQLDLLQLENSALQQKRVALMHRYSAEQKTWEQDRVTQYTREVSLLEGEIRKGVVNSPGSGIIYSISVRPGAYVSRGQIMAKIYDPGNIRIRAYVDEPDLGSIRMGQAVAIQWDGLPGRVWTGSVSSPAKDVVPLGNRSVGHVICAVQSRPGELIPNSNVRLEIVAAEKQSAVVVPRSAVTSRDGHPAVMIWDGKNGRAVPVSLGLVTPEEVEIATGISAGQEIVLHPAGANP